MLRAPSTNPFSPPPHPLTLCSHPCYPFTLTSPPSYPTSPSPSPHLNPYPLQPPVGSLTGIDGYRVAVAPPLPDGRVLLDLPLTQTTLVLTDLSYFTEYTFQVAVYSPRGSGPFTDPVSARTGEGGGLTGGGGGGLSGNEVGVWGGKCVVRKRLWIT